DEDITTEYETLLSSLSTSFGITEETLLNEFKIPKEYIEGNLEKELIGTQYLSEATEVSDKEAQNYYDKNKDEFFSIQASHILIQTKDDEGNELSADEKKEKKAEAESILKKIKEGADFATIAKEYSEDSSATSGGDLGFFTKGQMVQEFEDAAFALKVGDVTDELVETDYGYHIIMKTNEKYEEFEDVKEDIVYNLSYEKQSNTLDNLIAKYDVTVK
ncbi:MAG: peptidylprolyl isomerase, partial [Peptostreptococcaceae bacterium]